jgi:GDP-L-fucose synthase
MEQNARVYVAGHRGLVGSAIMRRLRAAGYANLITRTHAELDLTDEPAVRAFFAESRPEFVFLAAAKVGGIVANNTYPAEFIRDNLAIQTNVIHAAHLNGVKRLLFLGSSCIYPKHAHQPIRESDMLTGPLEPTNRPYALAKIAGIEMCSSYNRQYGDRFIAAMPTNLYGPGDNYHPTNSHVIPGLIRRFHEAKLRGETSVPVWGTGKPLREFLYSDDMADACVFLMNLADDAFDTLVHSDENSTGDFEPPLVNVGSGVDISIAELAELIQRVVGFEGTIVYERSKPDGTPRKVLDVRRLHTAGWHATTPLRDGLVKAYEDFLLTQA